MQQVVPLELLGTGEGGRIFEVEGDRELVVRLVEMGFRRGAEVRMLRSGSPCIVAVENHRMTFRGDGTAVVLVEVSDCCDPHESGTNAN